MLGSGAAIGQAQGYSAQAQSYNDLQGLQQIKNLAQSSEHSAFTEIGKQFESLLMHAMIKGMRSANRIWSEDSLLSSQNVSFYQDMLDDQLSLSLVQEPGVGLAEQFANSLTARFNSGPSDVQESSDNEELSALAALPQRAAPRWPAANAAAILPAELQAQAQRARAGQPIAPALQAGGEVLNHARPSDLQQSNFVERLAPLAERAAAQLGVPATTLLAQAALESGWGEKVIAKDDGGSSFNLFGIKADSRWRGESAGVTTTEYFDGQPLRVRADFRAYPSYQHSFDDYVAFLQGNARYELVLEHEQRATEFPHLLQRAGYATDPAYASKIQAISNQIADQIADRMAQRAVERTTANASAPQDGNTLAMLLNARAGGQGNP